MINIPFFPPRPWSKIIIKTNGRALDIFKYCCCFTSSTQVALNRVIGFWSGCLLIFNIILLLICLSSSQGQYSFIIKLLFPKLLESLTKDIGVLYILLYISAVLGLIIGFIGVITTSTYNIFLLKICMVCNYVNILKDLIFFITIVILLNKWNLGFIQAITFFFIIFTISILIGIFCSFVAENLLYLLEVVRDDNSTIQNTETTSDSTSGINTKIEENKDLELAKDEESRSLIQN